MGRSSYLRICSHQQWNRQLRNRKCKLWCNDDADNSGVLKYIRLEYTGYAFDEEHEANGVSFYGVGNGTTVEHLQAYMGSDDGFEFFGGSVNVNIW